MDAVAARAVVEGLLVDQRLWLPALSLRRGFSSTRVEHLLNGLVAAMPPDEWYLEVGTLEGRTIEAAAAGNHEKTLVCFDHEQKYSAEVAGLPPNVVFRQEPFEKSTRIPEHIGVAFYDGGHSAYETSRFALVVQAYLADKAVLVFDDWDRASVRQGVWDLAHNDPRFRLLAELPSYTDGLSTAPNHFGFYFGVSVWSYAR